MWFLCQCQVELVCCFYCCYDCYCYISSGNIENLTRSSKIWPKIKETLQKQDALDTYLTLRCQVHPSVFTRVSSAADFQNVPEGGCLQICGAALPCGHICKSVCHVRNREHGNVRCSEQCERWGGCFMSEDNCFCLNWRGRKNTADVHVLLTQFPLPSLWHTVNSYSTTLYVWELSWTPQPLKMMALNSFIALSTLHSVTLWKVMAVVPS